MEATTINPGAARCLMLRALRDLTAESGRIPSLGALAAFRGLSVPGAKKQLDWLERNGLIAKVKYQPRSAIITEAGRLVLKNRRAGR